MGPVGLGRHFRHSQASSVGGKETAAAVVLEEEGEENGHMAIVANPLLSVHCSGGGGVKICGGELKSVSLSSKRSTVTLGEGLTM